MKLMQFMLCVVLGLTLLGGDLHAKSKDTNGITTLGDGEKCEKGEVCRCVNVDVKVGCECKITLGSGTQHCPVGSGGGPGPLNVQTVVLSGLGGALLGSLLTFAVMRRRK
jgi:hypothetical protein